MELRDKISAFIRENMAIIDGHAVLNDSDNIFELGFVDSMFAMQLVTFVESEFKIIVENQDLDITNFNSVNNIIMFIERKQSM